MTNESARIILLQMLDGLDPTTGEVLPPDHLLNDAHGHPRAAYGRAGADGHFPSSQGSGQPKRPPQRRPGVDGDGPGRAGRSQPVGRVHGDDVRKAAQAVARRGEAAS